VAYRSRFAASPRQASVTRGPLAVFCSLVFGIETKWVRGAQHAA
jgi:hypothetical protein